jgi:hypothetical protein
MDIQIIIEEVLGGYLVPNKRYPQPLPQELSRWYCYTSDGGHCILAVLEKQLSENPTIEEYIAAMVPAPVKSVLRGYRVENEFVIMTSVPEIIYDFDFGLRVPPEDNEF